MARAVLYEHVADLDSESKSFYVHKNQSSLRLGQSRLYATRNKHTNASNAYDFLAGCGWMESQHKRDVLQTVTSSRTACFGSTTGKSLDSSGFCPSKLLLQALSCLQWHL